MVPVKIIYGPYESNGIIRHKKQRLWGVCKKLSTLGFTCELIPCDHYERLYIQMLARDIFQCNIKQLKFNCPHEDDVLCQRIVECVKEAHTRLYSERNTITSEDYIAFDPSIKKQCL